MSWFTKKDNKTNVENIPQLPELPESPNTNFILRESQEQNQFKPPTQVQASPLSLPLSPQKSTKDYSQENISRILDQPKPGMQKSKFDLGYPEILDYPIEKFGISKFKQPDYQNYQPPADFGIAKTLGSFKPSAKSISKKDDSVYIRLDKFNITMEAFRDIKEKIREIEELLAKTKEIKSREEKEIEEWEREIEAIKLRLDSINKEISAPEE